MDKEEQIITSMNNLYNKIAMINKLKLAEYLKNDSFQAYTSSEMLCIEYVGDNLDPNVTKLSEVCYMTRSALSKMTKRLIRKGILESYQKPDNKKEIYFRLTDLGRESYDIHEHVTNNFIKRDKIVFDQTPVDELESILMFFERYSKHLDVELKKMDIEK